MKRIAMAVSFSLFIAVPSHAGEGFGFAKKAANMVVRHPPAINVTATRFKVIATSQRSRVEAAAQTLRKYVEDALVGGHMAVDDTPELTVSIDLDQLQTDVNTESKVEYESEKTKDANGKTKYVDKPKTKYYTTANSKLEGTFKITGRQGSVIDSGDVDDSYHHTSEYWTPDERKIEDDLLRQASRKIASRIVPTTERVTVLMPKGSFESAIPLAEGNSWDRYLAAVQAVPAKTDPRSDAFREYALGVGKEGLAHATDDKGQALSLLSEAREHYQNAVRNNPGEKLFSERYNSLFNSAEAPVKRVEAAIAAYDVWVHATLVKETPTPVASTTNKAAHVKPGKVMRNQSLIDMKKAGLDDDNVIMAIESAASTDFDVSSDGLISLSKAGVSNEVIKAIQRKQP
ncbi:MAG: hypothetical protein ABI837_12960 [Acidobacteriota bacterium]